MYSKYFKSISKKIQGIGGPNRKHRKRTQKLKIPPFVTMTSAAHAFSFQMPSNKFTDETETKAQQQQQVECPEEHVDNSRLEHHSRLIIRRSCDGGYEFTFKGRVVRIGCSVDDSSGSSSRVFHLWEIDGHAIPFIIRFTPSKDKWEQERNGIHNQIRAAAECDNILEVELYGTYFVEDETPSSDDNGSPPPGFNAVVQQTCGLFAILPLCHGGDLFHLATNTDILGKMPAEGIARICTALTKSLKGLRDKQVIHGDIKPENICFRRCAEKTRAPVASTLVLIDFGFSTFDRSNQGVLHACGTHAYLAPEVYDNHRLLRGNPCTSSIDMFSAGATLYVLCNEWLRTHHHDDDTYPGKSTYESYLMEMDRFSPRERDTVYGLTHTELIQYENRFPTDRDGIAVAKIIQYVISTMTAYRAEDRPTPSQAIGIFEHEILQLHGNAGL